MNPSLRMFPAGLSHREQEKVFKQALRSGLGRQMPFPLPIPALQEKASATPLQPPPDLGPIHTWDPVPTLEQFGMRRPWNGLAEPAPPISRTMTLVGFFRLCFPRQAVEQSGMRRHESR